MATVPIPSSVAARKMRIAISPRFAAITLRILRAEGAAGGVGMGPPGEHIAPLLVDGAKLPAAMHQTSGAARGPKPTASEVGLEARRLSAAAPSPRRGPRA